MAPSLSAPLAERVLDHKYHRVAGITSWYNINQLVYYERQPDFETATAREQSLKSLLREAKVQLIDAFNPEWTDLYADICDVEKVKGCAAEVGSSTTTKVLVDGA